MQSIYNIAEICAQHGVEDAILSPGSRCAPLTIAFANHPKISCKSIPDERSAAFIAMGIAQQKEVPVVLICTSGTAGLNYYPAIAEAFYQGIPLIVLTADRPAEWIDQQDGQAIRQNNVYQNHIKKSWTLPTEYSEPDVSWHIERIISEALLESKKGMAGPVHINVPFREPFYPDVDEEINYSSPKVIQTIESENKLVDTDSLQTIIKQSKKTLIVTGQQKQDTKLNQLLDLVKIPIFSDTISNISCEHSTLHHDLFLGAISDDDKTDLKPDLLITFGLSIVSKNVKLFLRKYRPKNHIHIGETNHISDTFQSLTHLVPISPVQFFDTFSIPEQTIYLSQWKKYDELSSQMIDTFFTKEEFSEFEAVKIILNELPKDSTLHVANSMPIRYVNFLQTGVNIQANRGTSGIDGSLSTAVGAAIADPNNPHIALLGDLSFFYDRNALWNNYVPDNLKIIVLNNHGGGIFRMINGPKKRKELEDFFVTEQKLSAKATAIDHGFDFIEAKNKEEVLNKVKELFSNKSKMLLEIETDGITNTEVLDAFKLKLKQNFS